MKKWRKKLSIYFRGKIAINFVCWILVECDIGPVCKRTIFINSIRENSFKIYVCIPGLYKKTHSAIKKDSIGEYFDAKNTNGESILNRFLMAQYVRLILYQKLASNVTAAVFKPQNTWLNINHFESILKIHNARRSMTLVYMFIMTNIRMSWDSYVVDVSLCALILNYTKRLLKK